MITNIKAYPFYHKVNRKLQQKTSFLPTLNKYQFFFLPWAYSYMITNIQAYPWKMPLGLASTS